MGDAITLFAIVNPIGNIPLFMEMTRTMTKEERIKTFNIATFTGAVLLFIFSAIGQQVLEKVFHISLNDLKIAGGLVLIVIAIKSIAFGRLTKSEIECLSVTDISAVPLAFPLLVGPGALVTTVLILQRQGFLISTIIVVGVFIFVWLVFRFIAPLFKLLGEVGSKVFSKVMYIFLAAIAVRFIITGVMSYLKK